MSTPKPVIVAGPYKGVELREASQTPQHLELAINVDLSGGRIEARKTFCTYWDPGSSGALLIRGQLWLTETIPQRILNVGVLANGDIAVHFYGTDSIYLSAYNLTTVFGEPPATGFNRFECSFVNTTVLINRSGVGAEAVNVTIISTKYGTYLCDGVDIARGLPTSYAIKQNSANIAYWNSQPKGTITCLHQSRLYQAGFAPDSSVVLSKVLESDQNLVPDILIKPSRTELSTPEWAIAYSDEYDPLGFQAHHIFGTANHEKVTGLASFQDNLIILTDQNIHTKVGGTDAEFRVFKSVSGVGCVAPRSIIEVQGILYWVAMDGIHAYAGAASQGAPSTAPKISTSIDPFFTGRWDRTRFPEEIQTKLTALGYPWTVDPSDLRYCQAMHYRERNQIWWSMPVKSRAPGSFAVTLVLDYILGAWTFFVKTVGSRANANLDSCMYSGLSVRLDGAEKVYTTNAIGEFMIYGGGNGYSVCADGSVVSTDYRGVPLIWMTPRLFPDNILSNTFRPVRLKLLSKAALPATNPPRWFIEGEEAHADVGLTGRQQQSGNLTPSPTGTQQAMWGTGKWGTGAGGNLKYSSVDWFTQKIECNVRSQALRFGVIDDPGTDTSSHKNTIVVESFSIGVAPGEGH